MSKHADGILKENRRRLKDINVPFNPITGDGSIGERFKFSLSDTKLGTWYLPCTMKNIPLVRQLVKAASIGKWLKEIGADNTDEERDKVLEQLIRIRLRYDFPFCAALLFWIKNKGGGEDVRFRLTRPQRKLVAMLEDMRLANLPIRIILLKARQWGGSTTIQLYMAWLQLVQRVGLNSLIIAHQGTGSDEIQSMFQRMIERFPVKYLHKINEAYDEDEIKWKGVGKSGAIHHVPQRMCNVKVGSAERPDSCRGGDYNLVHLSEVGLYPNTEKHTPEMIVRSACSGVLYKPYTMIVYESTADGTGSFFHTEWLAAQNGGSQFKPLFIAWYDIDQYSLDFDNDDEREQFAQWLYDNKDTTTTDNNRQEPGRYYWYLWERGATLEALHWYVHERAGKNSHAIMAAEFPSDPVEAFTHAGQRAFDQYQVEKLRKTCRAPRYIGEVSAKDNSGKNALKGVRFTEDNQGLLWIWYKPEIEEDIKIKDRYLVVVDIGGRSHKADWSVITVFDRLPMADGLPPTVVAQWRGHIDHDLLTWKAAQIAAYYNNALLVIESNTLETKDQNHDVDGDQSAFILNQLKEVYPNLYARKNADDAIQGETEVKYGFHTNVLTKPKIITWLQKCIRERLYVERDTRCIDEYLTYEKDKKGAYNAIQGKHDDLLMTRAIGLWIAFNEMPLPVIIDVQLEKKRHAAALRRMQPISAATI